MNGGCAERADRILELAMSRPPRLGATRLVCVDGPAGSGKTTLADELVATARRRGITVALVHMDDVYEGWTGLADAGPRVRDRIVEPLAAGRRASYQRYDWDADRFAEEVAVPPVDLLVLEGVGSGDPSYQQHVAALVWVEAPAGLRLRRGLERDGPALQPQWRTWMVEEQRLHARDLTPQRADVLVDGQSGEVRLAPAT